MLVDVRKTLDKFVKEYRPTSILTVGVDDPQLFDAYLKANPGAIVHALDAAKLLGDTRDLPRFDLALVANTLERLDQREAGIIIARLRDLHARRLLVLVPIGQGWASNRSHWESGDLLGFGMRRLARYRSNEGPVHLYRFDLADYKPTPEWLNPKDWANPEMWGKYPKLFDED
jgi:hypothetical protein